MKTTTFLIAILMLFSSVINGQNINENSKDGTINIKPPIIGIGLKTSPFNLDDLYQDILPTTNNKIVLTFNPVKNFRIQPEFGYYSTKEYSSKISDNLVAKNFSLGAGFYGMWQKGNVNFYIGPKFTSSTGKDDSVDSDYNPNPPYNTIFKKITNSSSLFNYGLITGGEYFFGNHFSIGAELGLMHSKLEVKYSETPDQNYTLTRMMTESSILFRFYF